jgi:hypothetical protein
VRNKVVRRDFVSRRIVDMFLKIRRQTASLGLALSFGLFLITGSISGQNKKLSAIEAKSHIGENATVCGKVVSARYASSTRGSPTFLDFDAPYPKSPFTVLIWGENRAKFGAPEEKYRDKNICATGQISSFRGSPEIVVSEPSQIEMDSH